MSALKVLEVLDWGLLRYGEALARQRQAVEARVGGGVPDRLALVEHPPVVTLGRGAGVGDLCVPREVLTKRGVEVFEVERGGQATCHEPGQFIAYPILALEKRDLRAYVRALLGSAAAVLRGYGLEPEFREGAPGLWVGGGKIASIGIAVKRWVTYHGIAVNVSNRLETFRSIVPCGNPSERVTSMERELGRAVDLGGVKARFAAEFRRAFGYAEEARRRPSWLRVRATAEAPVRRMEDLLGALRLGTVCQSAHCPNLGECFERGTATFLILGTKCTRRCSFCAVDKATPGPADPGEPERVADAVRRLGLRHVVITSVTRDDLPDGGAAHFVQTMEAVRRILRGAGVEVLVPDFGGSKEALDLVLKARPDVFNHNVETVPRLYPDVRPEADYRRSLRVLQAAAGRGLRVKSGLMLGLGERDDEVRETLRDLQKAGCTSLTLGQYLAPSPRHHPVVRYVPPEEFEAWGREAESLSFRQVAAGPLVRSSYRADRMNLESALSEDSGDDGSVARSSP